MARLLMPNISRRIEARGHEPGVIYPLAATVVMFTLVALSILIR